jgi:eukaryotic-like serine/threonine-protein kinase
MEKQPKNEEPTVDLSPGSADRICEQFEARWREAAPGGPAPALEPLLSSVPETERGALRQRLQRIEQKYRRLPPGAASAETAPGAQGPTVDLRPPGPPGLAPKAPPPPAAATDSTPGKPTDPGATVAFRPPAPPRGHETVAFPKAVEVPTAHTIDLPPAPPPEINMTVPVGPQAVHRPESYEFALGPAPTPAGPKIMVAGYELLGELGRGGMGVVYKARQAKLNRLVALKMVLAGAHAGSEQLARFFTEAEAVAHLQHPNIVQIHEVGEHEGLPFFSLEFLDGGSLTQKLDGKALPAREAAELAVQLAEAMAFAHLHGIIHRDLKPANVLLTKDGVPKITDFGLAKKLEGDSGQTRSGQLMGTPSYMAPEQAQGDVKTIGPLADVYALGVILYEMLTGRTPFVGVSIMDTLEQVRTAEPVPPSRLQHNVPHDLETICLKCLQKEPHKRYASAQALARDLHHFLKGEPIEARPVGNVERLWRWCRRNPKVAALTAAVAVLLVAAAVGSTAAAITISREKAEVERQREAADEARQLAEERQKAEAAAKLLAETNRQKADENAKVADGNAKVALETMYKVVSDVEEKLRDKADMLELRKAVVKAATEGLDKLLPSPENAGLADRTRGIAHQRVGDVLERVGQTEEAIRQYKQSLEIFDRLAVREPNNDWLPWNKAVGCDKLAEMCRELEGDARIAVEYYRQSLELREALAAKVQTPAITPAMRAQALAVSYIKLASLTLELGDPARSQAYARKALEQAEKFRAAAPTSPAARWVLGYAHFRLAKAGLHRGAVEEARRHYEECLKVRHQLVKDVPQSAVFQREVAGAYDGLGELELELRDTRAALDFFQKAHAIHAAMYQKDHADVLVQLNLGNSHYHLGAAYTLLGDRPAAEKEFAAALTLREGLLKADPKNLQRRLELMLAQARWGRHAEVSQAAEEVRQRGLKSPDIAYAVACAYAQCVPTLAAGNGQNASESQGLQERYAAAAVEVLRRAVAEGYRDVRALETDSDLQPLQTYPAYQELLKEVRASARRTPAE